MSQYKDTGIIEVFGRNVRHARERRGYTIQDLATMAHCDRVRLSKIERGEKGLQLSTAVKLAQALDVPLSELLARTYLVEAGRTGSQLGFQMDDFMLVFSTNIKSVLRAKHRYAVSIYPEIGMDPATVSRILSGKVQNPRITTLDAIAHSVCRNLCELISRTTKEDN